MAFKYNDILISEVAYACVVKRDVKDTICSYCFKEKIKLHTCTQCNLNSYCDKDCQRKDWKQHKLECKSIASTNYHPNDITLLILRIICKNKNGLDCKPVGIISNKYGFNPRCFNDLVSNLNDAKSDISADFDMMMNELERFLKPSGVNINEFISEENVKIVFAKSLTNNFEIQNDMSTTIGYGCYLNGSGFNHSCWPNSVYNFVGNKLVLRALKNIEPSDKVFINYTDPLQLRADRRARLREQYLFECQCEACSNDRLEREMSELPCSSENCKGFSILMEQSVGYQCDECNQVEDKSQMEMRLSIHKAKLFHINNLMIANDYKRAFQLARQELDQFHLDSKRKSSGGLYQLCYGEKAFESAIFLQDYGAALAICGMKWQSKSWIHESLSRFLGTENHPIARGHLEKYRKLIDLFA